MPSLRKLAGQSAIYGLSSIVGRLLNYLLVPLHVAVFTTSEYGVITEFYAYIVFFLILLTYGMETTFFRFASRTGDDERVFVTVLVPVFIWITAFILVMQFAAPPIAKALDYPNQAEYVRWLAIIVGLDAFTAIPFAKLRREDKALRFVVFKLVNIAVFVGLNVLFLLILPKLSSFTDWDSYNTQDVRYVFLANLIASIVTLIVLLPDIWPRRLVFDRKLWRQMFRYATPLVVAGFAGMGNEYLDRILLKHLILIPEHINNEIAYVRSQLGIYGANYKLAIFMTLFIQMFRYAAEPFIFSAEKEKGAKAQYATILHYFTIFGWLIFLGVGLFLQLIADIFILDKDFHEGLHIVPVLLVANLLLGINVNLGFWYKLTERTVYGAFITSIGAIVTIVANIALVPSLGYTGAAWATLACYSVMVLLNAYFGRKYYPIPYNYPALLFYSIIALSLYFISEQIQPASAMILYGSKTIFIFVFVLIVYIREKNTLKSIIKSDS